MKVRIVNLTVPILNLLQTLKEYIIAKCWVTDHVVIVQQKRLNIVLQVPVQIRCLGQKQLDVKIRQRQCLRLEC